MFLWCTMTLNVLSQFLIRFIPIKYFFDVFFSAIVTSYFVKSDMETVFRLLLIVFLIVLETINYIISECSKLAQKEYKARYDLVGRVIHRELCKKFKFDQANKWYMHNPESVLGNETHKLLWDFEM